RKYDETERALIEEFANAQRKEDFKRMKEVANVLSQFKGYPQCVDVYIERSQAVRRFFFVKYNRKIFFFRVAFQIKMFLLTCSHCVNIIMKLLRKFLIIQNKLWQNLFSIFII